MSQTVWHSGIVDRTEQRKVVVRITSRSACGSCAARQACGLAEATEKLVEVYTDGEKILSSKHIENMLA